MIVQPNFLDHWKTRMLVAELQGDEMAPLYLLRLWGHCQDQKTSRFKNLTPGALTAICRAKTSPETLFAAMKISGFIVEKSGCVVVHQWEEYNAGLLSSWNNGKKGGRPSKPTGNPRDTQRKPTANPDQTRSKPIDKIDKIDKNNTNTGGEGSGSAQEQTQTTQTPPPAQTPVTDKSPSQIRAEAIFNRRLTTPWGRHELTAWEKKGKAVVESTPEEDWRLLERFYAAKESPGNILYRRKDLATLINNWAGEIDKARKWAATEIDSKFSFDT